MRRAAVACLLVMGLTLGVSALRATPIAALAFQKKNRQYV